MLNNVSIDIIIDGFCHSGCLYVGEEDDIFIYLPTDGDDNFVLGHLFYSSAEDDTSELVFKLAHQFYDEEKDNLDKFNIKYDLISREYHESSSECFMEIYTLKITSKIEVKISMEANSGD